MKLSTRISGARLLAVLFIVTAIAGCGDPPKNPSTTEAGTQAVTMEKKFNVPPGADPSVTAEMGGAGFEKIAADSGWKTSTMAPEEFRLVADTNAKKGGEISLPIPEFPATFRAYGKDENSQATRAVHNLVYESLLGINPLTLDFLPALATHWKVDPDGQTYYFRIDPNARFSDGHAVSSEDFLATYNLGKDSTILEPYTNTFFSGFDPPVAISKYIVSIRSKEKNWKNMFYIASSAIMPAHVISTMNGKGYLDKFQYEMPPGTGPYVVRSEDIKKGNSVTLTRRADWWGANEPMNRGLYNFDKIRLVVVREDNVTLEKFQAGEIDLYPVNRASFWVEKFDFDAVKRGLVQRQKIFNNNPVGFGGIAFNTTRAPFNDAKVRRALTLLFNCKELVEKLMYNEYELSTSYYPSSIYANPNNPPQEYNPEKAIQLLSEAGYTRNAQGVMTKNGRPLELEMLTTQDMVRIVTPYQQDLQKAGIKVNFRVVDQTTRFKMVQEKAYQMSFMQWGGLLYPNPISSYHSRLVKVSNSNNVTGFSNARADQIMELEQVTFDQATRVKLLRELDSILIAANTYAPAYHVPYVRVAFWNKFGMPEYTIGRISDWDRSPGAIATWWYDPEKAATVAKGRSDKSVTMPIIPLENRFWEEYDKKNAEAGSATAAAGQGASRQ